MSTPTVGFIGFGEAAFLISEGLKKEGIQNIVAFDVFMDHPKFGSTIQNRAAKINVPLVHSLEELSKISDFIFCAASAKVALPIAEDVANFLTTNHVYIDINATSPMIKEEIATVMKEVGVNFVDAAVMDPVPLKKHKVPLYISGTGARDFEEFATTYGMNVTFIGEQAGGSSAIKMFRSIFMKGISMLLLETIQSSSKYGVTNIVLDSLNKTITGRPLEDTANLLLNRTAIHAERRVSEMDGVIDTLKMLNIDSTISEAVKTKLQSLVDLKIKELLNGSVPEHYSKLVAVMENQIKQCN